MEKSTTTSEYLATPASRDAEASLLGAVLIDPPQLDNEVVSRVKPSDFQTIHFGWAWKAFTSLKKQGLDIDEVTLQEELDRHNQLEEFGGFSAISKLSTNVPTGFNAPTYATTVWEMSNRRQIKKFSQRLTMSADNLKKPTSEWMPKAIEKLNLLSPFEVPTETFDPPRASQAFEDPEPTDWIIKDLVASGSVNLLYGNPGTGKTYSLFDAATCIATGEDWLNYPTTQGAVLILDWESGRKRLKKRLRESINGHEADRNLPIHFEYMIDKNIDIRKKEDSDSKVNVLINSINKYKFKLIIIDSFRAALRDGNENDSGETQVMMTNLRKIATATDVAIFLIHHSKKTGGIRGSSAIEAASDVTILCTKSENNAISFKVTKARELGAVNFNAKLHVKTDEYAYLLPTVKISKKEQHETAILELLESSKTPLTKNKIYDTVKGRKETVINLIDELVISGEIQHTTDGYIANSQVVPTKGNQFPTNGTSGSPMFPP